MRLIDLDAIMAQFPDADFDGDVIENTKAYPYWSIGIDGLINVLKAVPIIEQRWMPVSERLPKVGEKVLCQCQANIFEVLKLTVDGWYHDDNHCYMLGFVIAWQPLPQPYAESEGQGMTEEDKLYADKLRNKALSDYERLNMAIDELERQTCDTPRNNLAETSQVRMTLEEALKKVRGYLTDYLPLEDADEIDEIIEALEPSVTPSYNSINTELKPCEDCISREAAIDVVRKWFDKMQLNGDICLDGIISLPSVTPTSDAFDKIINKIEQTRDKDKIAEYPYNRCIRIVEEYKNGEG